MPESSINYESQRTEKALEWTIVDFPVLQFDFNRVRKQNIFISRSNVYFENKWSSFEL